MVAGGVSNDNSTPTCQVPREYAAGATREVALPDVIAFCEGADLSYRELHTVYAPIAPSFEIRVSRKSRPERVRDVLYATYRNHGQVRGAEPRQLRIQIPLEPPLRGAIANEQGP